VNDTAFFLLWRQLFLNSFCDFETIVFYFWDYYISQRFCDFKATVLYFWDYYRCAYKLSARLFLDRLYIWTFDQEETLFSCGLERIHYRLPGQGI